MHSPFDYLGITLKESEQLLLERHSDVSRLFPPQNSLNSHEYDNSKRYETSRPNHALNYTRRKQVHKARAWKFFLHLFNTYGINRHA